MARFHKSNLFLHTIKVLFSNKIRLVLMFVGIVIGVAALTFNSIDFNNRYKNIYIQYEQFGFDTIVMEGDFSKEDFFTIDNWDGVENIIGYNPIIKSTIKDENAYEVNLIGAQRNFLSMPLLDGMDDSYVYYSTITNGRNFTEIENSFNTKVTIITESSSFLLFGDENPIGRNISVKLDNSNIVFTIVGVVKDSLSGIKEVEKIYKNYINDNLSTKMPITMYIPQVAYNEISNCDNFYRIVMSGNKINKEEVYSFLRNYSNNHKRVDITSSDEIYSYLSAELLKLKNTYLFTTIVLSALSTLLLGVVILFSIKERVYEIGLKKALGAKESDIALQFVGEFSVIGLVGSLIGVVLGILVFVISAVINLKGLIYYYVFPSVISIISPFFIMLGLICVFSIIPAIIAAKVRIVDAIRFE